MELEDLVDVDKLTARLAKEGSSVFHYWTATALDISRTKYDEIANLQKIYLEIPASELRPMQIMTFVRELVRLMPSIDEKKSLLRAEALGERKFERPATKG